MKKLKKTQRYVKVFHEQWNTFNLFEIVLLPKAIYKFNAIPITIPMAIYKDREQKNDQYLWKH